jgi:hypothetical protein
LDQDLDPAQALAQVSGWEPDMESVSDQGLALELDLVSGLGQDLDLD